MIITFCMLLSPLRLSLPHLCDDVFPELLDTHTFLFPPIRRLRVKIYLDDPLVPVLRTLCEPVVYAELLHHLVG